MEKSIEKKLDILEKRLQNHQASEINLAISFLEKQVFLINTTINLLKQLKQSESLIKSNDSPCNINVSMIGKIDE